MKSLLILMICIMAYSCQKQKGNENTPLQTVQTATEEPQKQENKQIGDTIFMNYKNEKNVFIADGNVDSIHSRIYVKFKNEFSSELNGRIIPEKTNANIRFNQIIYPDKTADGPFGTELKIEAKQTGDYILIIGHSQMAENPYWGKFEVQLENKKN
ncbi:hypothetical protein [Flavobacterium sp. IB48]|uniref:hypothetical protein n=1 Tax=Flavobacterium sp. IB48 TaxID=2779375 RepID=UPI0018E714CA|nr:hypothetical protein [Flavobacterium sp. IB48]MBJ2124807.1 hypothetical protein [Flavobacterium sp. IB48]